MSGDRRQHGAWASAFAHVDRLLLQLQKAGDTADTAPSQNRLIATQVTLIRSALKEGLQGLGVTGFEPAHNSSMGIPSAISAIQAALDEISRMPGADAAAPLAVDLSRRVRQLGGTLALDSSHLETRIDELPTSNVDQSLLRSLKAAITEHGLTEFQGTMHALIEQIESPTYEIAVLGRVSCGKSSLLNAILGSNVLPTGVTPVTAVATRVTWGEAPAVSVRYVDGHGESRGLEALADFVSEARNPDNARQVASVSVALPLARLKAGIALVDTPGVGSLATSGARQTHMYLPRCDLGVLLVDCGSAITTEDIDILRALQGSGISAVVVLSKADLLGRREREAMADYIARILQRELGVVTTVKAVSAVVSQGDLSALAWFDDEIAPRCERARELAAASAIRKLGALRAGVCDALELMLRSDEERQASAAGRARPDLRLLMLEADGVLHEAERGGLHSAEMVRFGSHVARSHIVSEIAAGQRPSAQLMRDAILAASRMWRSPMQQDLLAARNRLRDILRRMAAPFPFAMIRAEDIQVDLLGQPEVEIPRSALAWHFRPQWWHRWLPKRRRQAIASQLDEACAKDLEAAFAVLRTGLEAWLRAAVSRLANQFAAQADPIAIHLQDRPCDGTTDRHALKQTLEALHRS